MAPGKTAVALPERVAAVFVLSVPFTPRSPTQPDPAFAAIPRDTFFYIRYFQEIGRPEHELDRDLKHSLKTLRVNITLPGVGHWTQQEAPAAVSAALLGFLDGVSSLRELAPRSPLWSRT